MTCFCDLLLHNKQEKIVQVSCIFHVFSSRIDKIPMKTKATSEEMVQFLTDFSLFHFIFSNNLV